MRQPPKKGAAKTMIARVLVLPATLLCTTNAFQPPPKRVLKLGQRRLAPEEASVAVQAYADKAASAIAAAVAGADATLLASTGLTLASAGVVVAAAALGAAAMRLFNREERREMESTRNGAVTKAAELAERVKRVESEFFEADAEFEARTDALKKEYETSLKVRTDVRTPVSFDHARAPRPRAPQVLEQELRREKEGAIRALEEAQKLQLEEMKVYFAEETAEMRVGREKASLDAQTARQRAAEAAARAEAERTARPKRMF